MANWVTASHGIKTLDTTPSGDAALNINDNFTAISTDLTTVDTTIAALQTAVNTANALITALQTSVAGKAGKASPAVAGNAANIDSGGNVVDSGVTLASKASASTLTSHTSATSGVHGITGSVVGTTDTQVLSNKTLTAVDFINGGTISGDNSGDQDLSGFAPLSGATFSGDVDFSGGINGDGSDVNIGSGVTRMGSTISLNGSTGEVVANLYYANNGGLQAGVSDSFPTNDGRTVTVSGGLVVSIA